MMIMVNMDVGDSVMCWRDSVALSRTERERERERGLAGFERDIGENPLLYTEKVPIQHSLFCFGLCIFMQLRYQKTLHSIILYVQCC
ncbi:hypothetical protein L6164_020696 [Bauhinia variegata]|uniref:Uncharacterized protein n=1 Tax=Bauhinia variegata TaxID=167791 RepID=A0ACB9MXI3_BAUVA|nr:hypothetical protein L6164_020696 [Bauhinia variegata]